MMHTASLLHDDVIDHSPLRRGSPSAPAAFGNKLSVLAGNFVLGRASAMLARLGDEEVTALIAGVISDLVEGEVLQMKGEGRVGIDSDSDLDCASRIDIDIDTPPTPTSTQAQAWRTYLQKTYLKTASLMAKGARAAVTLGGCTDTHTDSGACREIAYAYGRNLGIAFQVRLSIFGLLDIQLTRTNYS
jgi:hexaprenyl-diphosphate synthase